MAALLYLCARPEAGAAADEYHSFRRAMGVSVDDLDQHDLVRAPLTDEVLGRYDGVVVGGSPYNVTDHDISPAQRQVEEGLELLAQAALEQRLRALFTCYGIGVVTRMLGGSVDLAHPEPTSSVWITLRADAASDPVFGPSSPGFQAFTAHKEATGVLPDGAVLLASSEACPVQAYRIGETLWATQFHPEVSPADFAERMTYYRTTGYFASEDFTRVQGEVLAATVSEPARLIERFAHLTAPLAR